MKAKSLSLDPAIQEKIINALEVGLVKSTDLDYFIEKGGELPPGPVAASPSKTKGTKTTSKAKTSKTEEKDGKIYFKKFNENKIQFNATCIKGRPELKKIRAEAGKFVETLDKMIAEDRRKEQKALASQADRRKKSKAKKK